MIEFILEHWPVIGGTLAALVAGGIAVRFLSVRSGRDSNIVNQKGANAGGDNVGRDKITRESKRR